MSQNDKIPFIPDISTSQQFHNRQGAICDSLRFSYDVDLDSALQYSQDGREIDFQFQDYPEYQFKNQDKSDVLDHSAMNRKLQIFEKYRNRYHTEQPNRNSDIVDSFDKIFNIKNDKNDGNTGKYLFKRKQNNEQNKKQITSENQGNNVIPVNQNLDTRVVIGEIVKIQSNEAIARDVGADMKKKKQEGNENLKQQELNQNINLMNSSENCQNKKGLVITELSISTVSNNSSQSGKSDFQLRQLNFANPFNNNSNNQILEPENKPTKQLKQFNQSIEKKPNVVFILGPNKPTVQSLNTVNKPQEIELSLNKLSISKPSLSTSSVSSVSNSKTPSIKQIQATEITKFELGEKVPPPPLTVSNVSINQNIDPSTRLANPIFDEENRIAPLFKKIRKMNSIYPNFNHPLINLERQAKFCNVLATVFEEAFLFLQKMTIKAMQKIKQPRYFPAQFAFLSFFLNSRWQYERFKQWQVLSATIKPRSNFPRNQIQQSKIIGALKNYKDVIQYYKEKKLDLNSEQNIKNYFKVRQKFWSLERNLRSISQDIYRIFIETQYPQFYYDYLKILRSPLPAKNDQKTIAHHQKVLKILQMNRQRNQPLSCSQVGQTVKGKLERQLQFLCPSTLNNV